MKNLILNNWAAKIASLVLASTLWFLIKKNIEPADLQSPLVVAPTDGSYKTQ